MKLFSCFYKHPLAKPRNTETLDSQVVQILTLFKTGYKTSEGDSRVFYKQQAAITDYIVQLNKAGCAWTVLEGCFKGLLKRGEYFKQSSILLNPSTFKKLQFAYQTLIHSVKANKEVEKFFRVLTEVTKLGRKSDYRDACKLLEAYLKVAEHPQKINSIERILRLLSSLKDNERTAKYIRSIAELLTLDTETLRLVAIQQQSLYDNKCLHFWVECYIPILQKNTQRDPVAMQRIFSEVQRLSNKLKLFVEIVEMLLPHKEYLLHADVKSILKLEINRLEAFHAGIYRLMIANSLYYWKFAYHTMVEDTLCYLKDPKEIRDLLDMLWISDVLSPKNQLFSEILRICYKLHYWRTHSFLTAPLLNTFVDRLYTKPYLEKSSSQRRYHRLSNKQLEEEKVILEAMHAIVSRLRMSQQAQLEIAQGLFKAPALTVDRMHALQRLLRYLDTKQGTNFLRYLAHLHTTIGTLNRKPMIEAALDIITVLHKQSVLTEHGKLFSSEWQAFFTADSNGTHLWLVERLIKALLGKGLLTTHNLRQTAHLLASIKEPFQLSSASHKSSVLSHDVANLRINVLINNVESLSKMAALEKNIFASLINKVIKLPSGSASRGLISNNRISQVQRSTNKRSEPFAIESVGTVSFRLSQYFTVLKLDAVNAEKTQENLSIISRAQLLEQWPALLLFQGNYFIDPLQINRLLNMLEDTDLLNKRISLIREVLSALPYIHNQETIIVSSPILESLVGSIRGILGQKTLDALRKNNFSSNRHSSTVTEQITQQLYHMKDIATISCEGGLTTYQQTMLLTLKNYERFLTLWQLLKEVSVASEGYCAWTLTQCYYALDEEHDLYAIVTKVMQTRGILDKATFYSLMCAVDRYTVEGYLPGHKAFCMERNLFVKCLFELDKVDRKRSHTICFRSFLEFVSNDVALNHGERLEALLRKFSTLNRENIDSSIEWITWLFKFLVDLQNQSGTPNLFKAKTSLENLEQEYLKYFPMLLQLDAQTLMKAYHHFKRNESLELAMQAAIPGTCSTLASSQETFIRPISSQEHSSTPARNRGDDREDYILPSTCYKRS